MQPRDLLIMQIYRFLAKNQIALFNLYYRITSNSLPPKCKHLETAGFCGGRALLFALCLRNRTWAIGLLQITGRWKSFPPARYRIIVLCYLMHPSSLPTLVKAAMHLSRCSRSCPAETCTRIRACPFGTTG